MIHMMHLKSCSQNALGSIAPYMYSTQHAQDSMHWAIWAILVECSQNLQSMLQWRNEVPQKDCVFVTTNLGDQDSTGMQAFDIACIHAFVSFTTISGIHYPCTIVCWFHKVDNSLDEDTGMWIVWPSYLHDHSPNFAVIHIDTIYHAAHLIPIYGTSYISQHIKPHNLYDAFCAFYVNKYVNHHAFKLASWSWSSPHSPIQLLRNIF